MLTRWLKNRTARFTVSLAGLLVAAYLVATIGGVVLTAAIIAAAIYFGTMITLWRIPNKIPEDAGFIKRTLLRPLVWLRNFLFQNSLITTILMALLAGWMVGPSTVTGLVAIAIIALGGDFMVQIFKDGLVLVNSTRELPIPKRELALS